jgi:hypothetical protein
MKWYQMRWAQKYWEKKRGNAIVGIYNRTRGKQRGKPSYNAKKATKFYERLRCH